MRANFFRNQVKRVVMIRKMGKRGLMLNQFAGIATKRVTKNVIAPWVHSIIMEGAGATPAR
jgi:hypothetical protein